MITNSNNPTSIIILFIWTVNSSRIFMKVQENERNQTRVNIEAFSGQASKLQIYLSYKSISIFLNKLFKSSKKEPGQYCELSKGNGKTFDHKLNARFEVHAVAKKYAAHVKLTVHEFKEKSLYINLHAIVHFKKYEGCRHTKLVIQSLCKQ